VLHNDLGFDLFLGDLDHGFADLDACEVCSNSVKAGTHLIARFCAHIERVEPVLLREAVMLLRFHSLHMVQIDLIAHQYEKR
jgi:hypothetical protein